MEFRRFDFSMVDMNQLLSAQHDLSMAVMSVAVVFVASLTMLHVTESIRTATYTLRRRLWISSGACVMGIGIWAMHFIGMLAFKLPIPIQFNVEMTLLSILPAVLGSSVFLTQLTKETFSKLELLNSGCWLAVGIGLMHFSGMEAIEVDAVMRYRLGHFIFTLLLAMGLSNLSLYVCFCLGRNITDYRFRLAAALVLAVSASTIHYVAMHGTFFYATGNADSLLRDRFFTQVQLGFLVAGGCTALVLLLLIATFVNRRFEGVKHLADSYVRAIIDNTAEGIITISDKGLIKSFNPTAESMFGYSASEIIGQNINQLMAEDMRSAHDGYLKLSDLHVPRVINQSRDLQALKKDGSLFPIELNVSPMSMPGEKIFIGILHDISERKKQEQLLKENRARYQRLTELASDWIWETDSEQRISYLSDSFQRLTGWPVSDVLGTKRQQVDHYAVDDNDSGWDEYTKTLNNHQPLINFKFSFRDNDNKLRYTMISGKPVFNEDDEFQGYQGTGTDITELTKARKDAETANKAKSEFLSAMSHELRTPLNAILGFAQLMEDDPLEPLSDDQTESVEFILKSGQHLLKLINDILDLTKIESGNIALSLEPLIANELFDECLSLIQPFADIHNISVTLADRPNDSVIILADITRIKQVVLNFLSNAIKYNTEKGKVTLSCLLVKNDNLRILIKDTGFGIPADQQSKLFLPFERLGAENSEIEGTGIGLVVCKDLMEKMHGSIGFESQVGVGSSFWIDIPLGGANEKEMPATDEALITTKYELDTELTGKILYIEDNPANVRLVEKVVSRYDGLELISAHTAELGISIATKEKPLMILMDINLPGMNGIEALAKLQKNPELCSIPVVAMSANASERDVEKGVSSGFDQYLSKPINLAELSKVINTLI